MKTFLVFATFLSLATVSEARERRRTQMQDVNSMPGSVQIPSRQEDEGCRYSINCGPGEVCVVPPYKTKGVCVDERSVVQQD